MSPRDFDFADVLTQMVAAGASDVHLSAGFPPAIRDKGRIVPLEGFNKVTPQQTREVIYSILNDDQRKRFENNQQLDFAYAIPNVARFRVNCFMQRGSVSAAFRLVPHEVPSLDSLGVPQVLRELTKKPRGFVLVTGPTGSGKSTTLAAMIDVINTEREDHILTIEDPIEFLHRHKHSIVNQREVGTDTADFHSALKRVLRQDPDVILVGEVRDVETVKTALTAAETGHLVFSTLHTMSATDSINRIIDFFPPHEQRQVRMSLASSLRGIVSQRLVEKRAGGRAPAVEVLVSTGRVFDKIVNPEETHEIEDIIAEGEYYGMQTFDQSLLGLYRNGTIDLREAIAASTTPHDLRLMIEQHTMELAAEQAAAGQ